MTLEVNSDYKLEVNSKKQLPTISNRYDIKYTGNYIITEINQRLEIDNYTVFHILNHKMIAEINNVEKNTRLLVMDPNKLVEKVRSIISNGLFIASHK